MIGGETLLRDNPICFLVQNGRETVEIPAVTVSVALPVQHPVAEVADGSAQDDAVTESSS